MKTKEVSTRIRLLRNKKGVSQKKMANDLGFSSAATVCAWENDQKSISANQIIMIARYLNVSVDYLLFGQTKDPIEPKSLTSRDRKEYIRVNDAFVSTDRRINLFLIIVATVTSIIPIFSDYLSFMFIALTVFFWGSITIFFLIDIFRDSTRKFRLISITYGEKVFYRHQNDDEVLTKRSHLMNTRRVSYASFALVSYAFTLVAISLDFNYTIRGIAYLLAFFTFFVSYTAITKITSKKNILKQVDYYRDNNMFKTRVVDVFVIAHLIMFIFVLFYSSTLKSGFGYFLVEIGVILLMINFVLAFLLRNDYRSFISKYDLILLNQENTEEKLVY